jgi:hypothetical protein
VRAAVAGRRRSESAVDKNNILHRAETDGCERYAEDEGKSERQVRFHVILTISRIENISPQMHQTHGRPTSGRQTDFGSDSGRDGQADRRPKTLAVGDKAINPFINIRGSRRMQEFLVVLLPRA